MLSFIHVSTTSVESATLTLPANASYKLGSDNQPLKGTDGKYTVYSKMKLEVPQTMEELAGVASETTVEVKLGETKYTVPEPVYDYIVGRKLRANQDMQQALKGDGKRELRYLTLGWYSSQGPEKAVEASSKLMASVRSAAATKEHNAWLDGLYTENKAAVDEYATKVK